ncbi:hypothetical protein TNCV_482101 [Trichonephila clavipes]|uniref:Uncharacterized protein n=1 Tax=Trichonephila clavipes TaxID=2585209 RepID=A0A8X6S8S6_TRICX|nr:hypothetical protein TNCV_482101 [Trichonephila clavipes]
MSSRCCDVKVRREWYQLGGILVTCVTMDPNYEVSDRGSHVMSLSPVPLKTRQSKCRNLVAKAAARWYHHERALTSGNLQCLQGFSR